MQSFKMTSRIKLVFLKLSFSFWFLKLPILSLHNKTAACKYTLDGYDIMGFNQNLDGNNEWDFYFRHRTVALYICDMKKGTC